MIMYGETFYGRHTAQHQPCFSIWNILFLVQGFHMGLHTPTGALQVCYKQSLSHWVVFFHAPSEVFYGAVSISCYSVYVEFQVRP